MPKPVLVAFCRAPGFVVSPDNLQCGHLDDELLVQIEQVFDPKCRAVGIPAGVVEFGEPG